jgi:hypothetical protein
MTFMIRVSLEICFVFLFFVRSSLHQVNGSEAAKKFMDAIPVKQYRHTRCFQILVQIQAEEEEEAKKAAAATAAAAAATAAAASARRIQPPPPLRPPPSRPPSQPHVPARGVGSARGGGGGSGVGSSSSSAAAAPVMMSPAAQIRQRMRLEQERQEGGGLGSGSGGCDLSSTFDDVAVGLDYEDEGEVGIERGEREIGEGWMVDGGVVVVEVCDDPIKSTRQPSIQPIKPTNHSIEQPFLTNRPILTDCLLVSFSSSSLYISFKGLLHLFK